LWPHLKIFLYSSWEIWYSSFSRTAAVWQKVWSQIGHKGQNWRFQQNQKSHNTFIYKELSSVGGWRSWLARLLDILVCHYSPENLI